MSIGQDTRLIGKSVIRLSEPCPQRKGNNMGKLRRCSNATCECNKALLGEQRKFCARCGTATVEADYCKCGEAISLYDNYCPKCGVKL
jgi:hypothetical protein